MNAVQYIKNVGKSMGYISIDVAKGLAPSIALTVSNTKDLSQELYQTIDDFKGKFSGNDAGSLKSLVKNTISDTWKNTRDDFLSGKWYNTERKSEASNEMMKSFLGDDFDLDFDDFGDFDADIDESDRADMAHEERQTKEIVGAIDSSVASAANTIAAATVKSTEYIANVQSNNTQALYNLNVEGFNNVGLGLKSINANLGNIISLAEPLTAHMQNSATFYTRSTELQEKAVSLLEKLVEYNTPEDKRRAAARLSAKSKKNLEEYINDGGINMASLFVDMKEAVTENVNSIKELLDLFGGGGGVSKNISASPISSALTALIRGLIPKTIKGSIKRLDGSLRDYGYNALSKASYKIEDSPIGFALSLLGIELPKNVFDGKIRTDRYTKGKVDWDGKSRKALMDVIPYYLSKMTAIMEGRSEVEVFNYDTGKFTTRKKIREKFDEGLKSSGETAAYRFDSSRREKKDRSRVTTEELNEFSKLMIAEGGVDYGLIFDPDRKNRDKYINRRPLIKAYLEEHPEIKRMIYKAAENRSVNTLNQSDINAYAADIGRARSEYNSTIKGYNETGEYSILEDGSKSIETSKTGIVGITDKNGYTSLDYLRGIYLNTLNRGGSTGGGGNGGNGNSPTGGPSPEIPAIFGARQAEKLKRKIKIQRSQSAEFFEYGDNSSKSEIEDIEKSLKKAYGERYSSFSPDMKKYLIDKTRAKKNNLPFEENEEKEKELAKASLSKIVNTAGGKIKDTLEKTGIGDSISEFFKSITSLTTKPGEALDKMINSIQDSIHELIFGEKGLRGWLFDKDKGILRKPMGAIKDYFGRKFLGDFYKSDEEKRLSGFDGEKNILAGIERFTPVTSRKGYTTNTIMKSGNYSNIYHNGKAVTKSGIVAVSEGELIIPAELNPFYNGTVNKQAQIRNEKNAINKFYGSFANGGTAGGDNSNGSSGLMGAASATLKDGFEGFGRILSETFRQLFGVGKDEKSQKQERIAFADIIKNAMDEIKPHAGDAIAGAIIGGGISLLTGGVIGPILGASIGAAGGLIMSSDKIQKFLFGSEDENGEWKNGLLGEGGKKANDFIKNQLPDTLFGGAMGLVAGAFGGSPLLGAFLGSAIGFASKSDGVQNFLFGKRDKETGEREGGFISKELQNVMKKALPGMSAGAIAGIAAAAMGGPFGVVGNMLIGAGIGGIATSEKFQNWLLGDKDENGKRNGGFLSIFRENFLDPVRQSFFNLAEKLRADIRDLAVGFFDKLSGAIQAIANTTIGRSIISGGRNLIDFGYRGLNKLTFGSLDKLKEMGGTVNIFKNINNAISKSNLKSGTRFRDKNGNIVLAEDRLETMRNFGLDPDDSVGGITTQILAGMQDKNELSTFSRDLANLYNMNDEDRKSALESGSYTSLGKLANKTDLSKAEIRRIMDATKDEAGRFKNPEIATMNYVDIIRKDVRNIFNVLSGRPLESTSSVRTTSTPSANTVNNVSGGVIRSGDFSSFFNSQTENNVDPSTNAGRAIIRAQERQEEATDAIINMSETTRQTQENQEEFNNEMMGTDNSDRNDRERRRNGFLSRFFGSGSIIGKAANAILKFAEGLGIIVTGFLALAATGIFDRILHKLDSNWGDKENSINVSVDANGNEHGIEQNEKGLFVDSKSKELVQATSIFTKRTDTASFSERAKISIGKELVGGTWLLIKNAETVVYSALRAFGSNLAKVPGLSRYGRNFMNASDDLAEEIIKKLPQLGGKSLEEIADKAFVAITVAMIIIDFTSGMQDAAVTFKVSNPTMFERIISGVLRAVKNDIPFIGIIGTLIPDATIIDIFMKALAPAFGYSMEDLKNRRYAAEQELAKYNEENGTDLSWSQYQKGVLHNTTWTEKTWETVKTGFNRTKQSIGVFADDVKNQGLKQAIINKGTSALNAEISAMGDSDGFVSAFLNGSAAVTQELLPGLYGEFITMPIKVFAAAAAGDIDRIASINFSAFEGDDSIFGQFFSHFLNPVLLACKTVGYPIAAIVNTVNELKNGFTDNEFDFGDNWFANMIDDNVNLIGHQLAGDIKELWTYKPQSKGVFGAIVNAIGYVNRVLYTPTTAIMWVVKQGVNLYDKLFGSVKDNFSSFIDSGKDFISAVGAGDLQKVWSAENPTPEDDPMHGVWDIGNVIRKVVYTPVTMVTGIGNNISDIMNGIGKYVTNTYGYLTNQYEKGIELFHSNDGTIKEFFTVDEAPEGPLSGLFKGLAFMDRISIVPMELLSTAGRMFADYVIDVGKDAVASFVTLKTDEAQIYNDALQGDTDSLWSRKTSISKDKPLWHGLGTINVFANKLLGSLLGFPVKWLKSFIQSEQFANIMNASVISEEDTDIAMNHMSNGEIGELWKMESGVSSNNPFLSTLGTIRLGAQKVLFSIPTMGIWLGKKTAEGITNIAGKVSSAIDTFKENVKTGEKYLDSEHPLEDMAKDLAIENADSDNPMSSSMAAFVMIQRMIGLPVAMAKTVGMSIKNKISDAIGDIKADANAFESGMIEIADIMSDDSKTYQDIQNVELPASNGLIGDFMHGGFAIAKLINTIVKFVGGFGKFIFQSIDFEKIWNGIKSFGNYDTDGAGTGMSAGSSGFVSQYDPRYANKSFGGSNIAGLGCGPAAASMVLGNSMNSNISAARRYQTGAGTDISYFGDVFSRNGKRPIYYNLAGGASGSDMINDIASGKPVVLMGRDPYNTSKANSPFGPNNHYVVARGFKNGGVVIDDPEMSAGGRVYDPSILRNVRAAVSAGGSRNAKILKFRQGFSAGASVPYNSTTDNIWAFFKQKGYSDAATAGILGNILAESNFNLTILGDDGKAFGLCQWHNYKDPSKGRFAQLKQLATSLGLDVSDLTAQLEYINSEVSSGEAGRGYKDLDDPNTAGAQFCKKFERPANAEGEARKRAGYAVEYYNHYSGKTFEYNYTSTGSTMSSINGVNSNMPRLFSLKSAISSAFSNAFSQGLGKFNIASWFGGNNTNTNISSTGIGNPDASGPKWATGNTPVDVMRSVLGTIPYSTKQRDVENQGSGDCVSTVSWAIKKAGGPAITTDARWQYTDTQDYMNDIWYNNGNKYGGQGVPPGTQANDLLFYHWPNKHSGYPDNVDHVELYMGDGNVITQSGPTGEKGPTIKPFNQYRADNLIKVARVKADWMNSGSGSGLPLYYSDTTRRSAGASNIAAGGIDKSTALLLKTIISLIETIMTNTNDISAIYKLLSEYCANNVNDAAAAAAISSIAKSSENDNARIEANLSSLKATVDAILAS